VKLILEVLPAFALGVEFVEVCLDLEVLPPFPLPLLPLLLPAVAAEAEDEIEALASRFVRNNRCTYSWSVAM
jgi:hypothetical protein